MTQFTDRSRGNEPPSASLIDTGDLHCVSLKNAQDGDGYIIRLWNHSDRDEDASLIFRGRPVTDIVPCGALEEQSDLRGLTIPAGSVKTFRFHV